MIIDKNKKNGLDFFERLWDESWTYIKNVVDIVREPILILDKNLKVLVANVAFYEKFKVDIEETENKVFYELGNGQWDIPSLRKLLEDILPKNTFFKGYELTHDFPEIGKKVMILNARQIFIEEDANGDLRQSIIMLAMEDVTEMMDVADMLARHTNEFQNEMTERTRDLESRIKELKNEITKFKK